MEHRFREGYGITIYSIPFFWNKKSYKQKNKESDKIIPHPAHVFIILLLIALIVPLIDEYDSIKQETQESDNILAFLVYALPLIIFGAGIGAKVRENRRKR